MNADLPKDEAPTVVVPPPPAPPEEKKSGLNKILVGAVIAILLVVIPASAYILSSRQPGIANLPPGQAAVCCEGGMCGDGTSFGRDENFSLGDCAFRNTIACDGQDGRGSGGVVSGGQQCSGGGGGGDPVPGQPCSPDNVIQCFNGAKYWCQPSSHTWSTAGDPCTGSGSCVISGYSCNTTTSQCEAQNAMLPSGQCGTVVTSQSNCNGGAGCGGGSGGTCTGGACPAGMTCAQCPEGQCSNVTPVDVCTVPGTQRCVTGTNGQSWVSTCSTNPISNFCSLHYLQQTVVCTGGNVCQQNGNTASCVPATGSPTPTGTGGGSCAHASDSCNTTACCSGENLVCQGTSGNRVCQQTAPGGSGDAWCMSDTNNPGLGCKRYQSYLCTALSNGQCLQNKDETHTTWQSAMDRASSTGCGQADMVCKEGIHDGELCGDFVIYDASCGPGTTFNPNPTNTQPPGATNTPALTQPPGGPQCTAIFVYDASGIDITPTLRDGTKTLMPGDTVTLATTKGASTRARFRFQGLTNFEETTQTRTEGGIVQFYVTTTIPTTVTTTSATVEVEVTIDGTTWN